MKILFVGIIVSIIIFFAVQTVAPFPYGLIIGLAIATIIVWRAAKSASLERYSLLNYRRVDPQTYKEQEQNKEAFRIIKKDFLEGKISKQEYEKRKREFGIDE